VPSREFDLTEETVVMLKTANQSMFDSTKRK